MAKTIVAPSGKDTHVSPAINELEEEPVVYEHQDDDDGGINEVSLSNEQVVECQWPLSEMNVEPQPIRKSPWERKSSIPDECQILEWRCLGHQNRRSTNEGAMMSGNTLK